ncbi:MAG TPA: MauE/DoxX family redox-associated membrane protein [Bryobacteraceae bacterium]|nr:MauE/DoxX family redox-associated membrane protein [Bryobacteraceae bacterium]
MSARPWPLVALVLRLLLGAVFVYAAWTKLRQPWELFALAIDSYQILPMRAVEFVARALPWLELLLGALLLSGFWRRISTSAVSLLLLFFFALMIRAYAKGMQISCGCFGLGEIISWKTLLRDGSLLACSLFVTWTAFRGSAGTRNNAGI